MHSRSDIAALLREHGLAPRRDLGQNFVVDANIVRKIARLADVGPGDHVVEIGAGLGSLTLALAETGATITAIEVDHGVAGVLRTVVADLANVSMDELVPARFVQTPEQLTQTPPDLEVSHQALYALLDELLQKANG